MVRPVKTEEIERILEIYASAREFMCRSGNPTQWSGGYPERELLLDDIKKGQLFGIESEDGSRLCGVFALISGEDPTYGYIDGKWLSDAPYGTIHRIAGDGTEKGTFKKCLEFARKTYKHLRVDTYKDNFPMQRVISENGFTYCGIIYLENGDPRLAYEWIG